MNPLLLFYSGQQYRRSDWFNKRKKTEIWHRDDGDDNNNKYYLVQ